MNQLYTMTAVSRCKGAINAIAELHQQLAKSDLACVVFFCSAQYDLDSLAKAITTHFADLPVFGCTTAGEITPSGYEQHSIIAIGFKKEYFTVSAALVSPISDFDLLDAKEVVDELTHASIPQSSAHDGASTRFMLTLLDGLSAEEEHFLHHLNSAAGSIKHFGGSAGDDITLAKTHVFYQGSFHQHSAIVLMFDTCCSFEVFSVNHVNSAKQKLVVTQADPNTRVIYELNGDPAALVYANSLNLSVADLTPEIFSLNPLAVKIGENYYFRSIQKVNELDNSLTFYCAVDRGIVLSTVALSDIFSKLNSTLKELESFYGQADLVLACDCFLRRLEIEHNQLTHNAFSLFKRHNIIGFNTYGEHINGIHLNQTFTAVYIGGPLNG